MKSNELQNADNYNKTIMENDMEIYIKYTNIIIQYLLLGIEKVKNHNDDYVKYILIKGIYTISYVFNILLKYTRNVDLTYHHCQKSYSYYIEFIGQIGDDAITYLQLNSKDAALFVYKKTIFEIPEGIKQNYRETAITDGKCRSVSLLIDIYNKLIATEVSQLKSEQLKNTEFINRIYTNIGRVNSKLIKLHHSSMCVETEAVGNEEEKCVKKNELFIRKIKHVGAFCDIMILKKTSNATCVDAETGHHYYKEYYKEYIKIIEYFIKKIRKANNLQKKFEMILTSRYFSEEFEEKIKLYNSLKFVNWIFSNAGTSIITWDSGV